MKLKLKSIEITPNIKGLGFPKTNFGEEFTLLKGENGAGKTQIMDLIVFALGGEGAFRTDIIEKCDDVRLTIETHNGTKIITRKISSNYPIVILDKVNNLEITATSSSEFSNWLFKELGIPFPNLIGTDGKPKNPDINTYLPCFYISQDEGWSNLYSSQRRYIEDQREEMFRILLGISPKNSNEIKKNKNELELKLKSLNEEIIARTRIKGELVTGFDIKESINKESLLQRKHQIIKELDDLKSGQFQLEKLTSILDSKAASLEAKRDFATRQASSLKTQIKATNIISEEVEAEIETLDLNSLAAKKFRSLCSNYVNCGLFLSTEESYSKTLLYLKDQLKDLQENNKILEKDIKKFEDEILTYAEQIKETKNQRNMTAKQHGFDNVIKLIEQLSRELIKIETTLMYAEKIDEQSRYLFNLSDKRNKIEKEIQDLKSRNKKNSELTVAVNFMEQKMSKWLAILNTKNLKGPPKFDRSFNLSLGDENFKVFKGSTRTRIVLAFQATLLETSLKLTGNHPRVLIFDTPLQHELKIKDLDGYLKELKKIMSDEGHSFQLVTSFTDFKFTPDTSDITWEPKNTFINDKGEKELKFLRAEP